MPEILQQQSAANVNLTIMSLRTILLFYCIKILNAKGTRVTTRFYCFNTDLTTARSGWILKTIRMQEPQGCCHGNGRILTQGAQIAAEPRRNILPKHDKYARHISINIRVKTKTHCWSNNSCRYTRQTKTVP